LGQHSFRQNCLAPSGQLFMFEVSLGINFTVSLSQRNYFTSWCFRDFQTHFT
jgi:hypothetical protein